jgi:hypothetical protein
MVDVETIVVILVILCIIWCCCCSISTSSSIGLPVVLELSGVQPVKTNTTS